MKNKLKFKKIAIIYDWIDKWGGVERLLLVLKELFPEADFFTSYFDLRKAFWAKKLKIETSFLQNFPNFIKKNRILSLPFYPIAFETFNFNQYDLVISVTSSFAKGVITKPQTYHICYLLTPTRFLWLYPEIYGIKGVKKIFIEPYLKYLKKWDKIASFRPDKILTISKTVATRCEMIYRKKADVVYPPFNFDYWLKIEKKIKRNSQLSGKFNYLLKKPYFLVVSRLEPYKKIDIVIDTFKKYNFSHYLLAIVGEGSQAFQLKIKAGKNILFFPRITDEELGWLYQNAQALIMPQEEDFGYVSLEAQFFSCPVIAFGQGGATETILDGKTGIFFKSQTKEGLSEALERFHTISYNLKKQVEIFGKENVKKFNKEKFKSYFLKYLKI